MGRSFGLGAGDRLVPFLLGLVDSAEITDRLSDALLILYL